MDILHFLNNHPIRQLDEGTALPEEGLVWVDYIRESAANWECWAEPLIGVPIEPQHVSDSLNPEHPSFFDGTADYDMLIFSGLGAKDTPFPLETRTAAFFLFDRILLTVRAPDNVSFGQVRQKLLDGRLKSPGSILKLTHMVLDNMVDRYLKIREPMDRHLTMLQDELLDPDNKMDDWRTLLKGRRVVRQLEALSEDQLEALDAWRRGTRTEWSSGEDVRIRDLGEHIKRVLDHASGQERDIESAVQLHFASVSHRTNRIMRGLTVMSAIFFPLTLITGIYGMNFQNMPELQTHYGYFVVLGLIFGLGGGLAYYFRRRRYL